MEYEWIDTWLGAPRFQRYVEQCEGNRGQALKLYEWNSLAGQTLMRDISHFEIALRNGYDKRISSSWEGESITGCSESSLPHDTPSLES